MTFDIADFEKLTRERLADILPDCFVRALLSYQFYESHKPDSRDFKDHHANCKIGLAHIEALLKLAQRAGLMRVQSAVQDREGMPAGLPAYEIAARNDVAAFDEQKNNDESEG